MPQSIQPSVITTSSFRSLNAHGENHSIAWICVSTHSLSATSARDCEMFEICSMFTCTQLLIQQVYLFRRSRNSDG